MSDDQLADYAVGSPARLALNVLAHKWTLLIVLALKRGPLRFTRLRCQVPGVTSQVLRDSLREVRRHTTARGVQPHRTRRDPVRAGAGHPGLGREERPGRPRRSAQLRRRGWERSAAGMPRRTPALQGEGALPDLDVPPSHPASAVPGEVTRLVAWGPPGRSA